MSKPKGWAETTLGELLPLSYGKALSAKDRRPGDVPVYGSSGVVGTHTAALTSGATIVVGRKGNVGATHLSPRPCWPIDTVYFHDAGKRDARFHAHLLRSLQLDRLDRSTTIPGLSRDDYNVVSVALPPEAEQTRIVEALESYLSRLDSAVEDLEAAQRKLKAYRASVLKSAVEGRLVPTEAELARKAGRSYEPADVLLERILKERRRRWEEAGVEKVKAGGRPPRDNAWKAKYEESHRADTRHLPTLPEGWAWASLEQVCSAIVDCPHSTPKWAESGRICVRTTEFQPGYLDVSGARFVSDETYRERIVRLRPEPGDILYSREGGILGIACQIPLGVDLCLGQRMMLIRAAPGIGRYVMHVLNSPWTLGRVSRLTGGSASPHLNVGDVKRFPVPLPPISEVERVVGCLEGCFSVADACERQIISDRARLARLRQSIFRWAFEGRLVDQDPNDEPADVLLARISTRRETTAPPSPQVKRSRKLQAAS